MTKMHFSSLTVAVLATFSHAVFGETTILVNDKDVTAEIKVNSSFHIGADDSVVKISANNGNAALYGYGKNTDPKILGRDISIVNQGVGGGLYFESAGSFTVGNDKTNLISIEAINGTGIRFTENRTASIQGKILEINAKDAIEASITNDENTAKISINVDLLDVDAGHNGIQALGSGSAIDIHANEVSVTAEGTSTNGIFAANGSRISTDANIVNISSSVRGIDISGASRLFMENKNSQISLTASGDQSHAYGLALTGNDTKAHIVADTLTIKASNEIDARGIHVSSNSLDKTTARLDIDANELVINVLSEKGYSSGIVAMSEGEIHIDANTFISAKDALVARGDSVISINEGDKNHYTQINGNINFDYDAPTSDTPVNSQVEVVLKGKNSYWKGNTTVSWNGTPTDVDEYLAVTGMQLTLSDEAEWTPTATAQDSTTQTTGSKYTNLNSLTLDNGVVNVTDTDINVTVESMKGTGIVNLVTDLKEAGQFKVEKAEDNSVLDVNLMKDLNEEWSADDLDAETAQALLSNVGGETVTTKTEVKEGLVNSGFSTDKEGNTTITGPNTLMQSALELASSAPLALNRIMINDVRKRLGDIRTTNGTHGAWARYDGGKLSGEGGLENDFHTIQVGIDTVPTADSARMGVAFSYTDSDAEYARGSVDMKAYSLAMYATKMFDNGMFVDVIGRMGTADTDMVVDGQHKGSMNNVALSLSGEMGWRFDVNEMLYLEPQAEVTYTYVNDDKLSLSTANYDVDAVNSLMGRVGFAAGLKCPDHFGNVYVRASAVHEFLGDAKITGTNNGQSNTYEIDGQDTWVEYGVGANFNLTKSTYMWADVERTTGGALDEDWRATVGVRYAW